MIIYTKNKGNPIICVPKPMSYSLDSYDIVITDCSLGEVYRVDGIRDSGNLSDFASLYIPTLNTLPVGEYRLDVSDGYSETILRIQADTAKPTVYTPDGRAKEYYYNND